MPVCGMLIQIAMKKDRRVLLLFFLLLPLPALASGGDVLGLLFIDFILFLLIILAIIKVKFTWTGKVVLFVAYVATMYLLFYFTNQVSYSCNLVVINASSAFFPPTVVYLTYLAIRSKFRNVYEE